MKIMLDIDTDQAFNYESGKSEIYTFKDYKLMIANETEEIH